MTSTPERTPAEELRAAAAKLRAVAWAVAQDRPGGWFNEIEITDAEVKGPLVWSTLTGADAVWIALTSLALAEPLAAWLEDGAKHYETYAKSHGRDIAERVVYHGLAVAHVISGGAS